MNLRYLFCYLNFNSSYFKFSLFYLIKCLLEVEIQIYFSFAKFSLYRTVDMQHKSQVCHSEWRKKKSDRTNIDFELLKNQHKTCKISTQKNIKPFTISGKSYLLHYLSVVVLHFIFIWIKLCSFYSSWKQLLQNRSFGRFVVL